MSAELKAKVEARGVTNLHAEHVAQAIVEDHLDHCDECEKDEEVNPAHLDDFDKKNKGKDRGSAKKFRGSAPAGDLRQAVADAREAGFSWMTILQLLLQGLGALLDALKNPPVPA